MLGDLEDRRWVRKAENMTFDSFFDVFICLGGFLSTGQKA